MLQPNKKNSNINKNELKQYVKYKDNTYVKPKQFNKKELENIIKDYNELDNTFEIKKPRAEANKIEKSLPNKNTVDFFNKIKSDLGPEYFTAALKIQNKRGNPTVNVGTNKGLPFHNRRNYNPFTNEINIPKGGELGTEHELESYITEVSHAGQPIVPTIFKFINNDFPNYVKSYITKGNTKENIEKNVYNNKNTVEGYTHNIIQPSISKEIHNYNPLQESKIDYNNYDNKTNMNTKINYAQGGQLTKFEEGGTHESSPLGGIPQGIAPDGSQNLVEQGETKNGNFVYSNRIALDKDLIKQFNLPLYIANKSVADASKIIDKKFEDRQDKYAQETRKTLLDRLSQAQEHLKAQEQSQQDAINQSIQANSQQVPDMMNGKVPEGMDEFVQSAEGIPQEGSAEGEMLNPSSPIAAFGGYQTKRYNNGGYIQGDNNLDGIVNGLDSTNPASSNGVPMGGIMGGLSTGLDLGKTAFGKATQDTSGLTASAPVNTGQMIGSSAMKGAQAGATFGAPGLLIGGAIGALAGLKGSMNEKKAATQNTINFAANTNRMLSDNYAADGGNLYTSGGGLTSKDRGSDFKPYPSVSSGEFAGGHRSYPIPTKADAVDALRLAGLHGRSDVRAKVYQKYPSLKHADGGFIDPPVKQAIDPSQLTPNIQSLTGIGTAPTNNNMNFDTKQIVRYQPGVVSGETGKKGFYLYSKNAGEPGFDPNRHREFINQEEMMAVQRTPQWIQYMKNQALINAAKPVVPQRQFADGGRIPGYGADGRFIKPLIEEEGLPNINSVDNIRNYQQSKGIPTTGLMGPKTTSAYELDRSNLPAYTPNLEGLHPELNSTAPKNLLGSMEQYYNASPNNINNMKTFSSKAKDALKTAGKFAGENVGEAMRYAPIGMNAFQLSKLQKPQGVSYNTLANRYKPNYVDEAQLQRIVDQEANNQIGAISQMGVSQGAARNAILGAGLNKTKALSEAYANAANQNRAIDTQAQGFNRDTDLQNINIRNRAIDEGRMDDAAYRSAKSKLLSTIGTDVGSVGKELADAQLAAALTGYTRKGKYLVKPDGTRVTPEEISKITNTYQSQTNAPVLKKGDKYTDENGVIKTFKYGGYLNTKKR